MRSPLGMIVRAVLVLAAASAVPVFDSVVHATQKDVPATIYWCPNRTPDQQLSQTPASGCTPLIDEETKRKDSERKEGTPKAPPVANDIQRAASGFLDDYRKFLACCVSDPDSLQDADELEDQASEILKAVEARNLANQFNMPGWLMKGIVQPVAKARDDLRRIKRRLSGIEERIEKLGELDYESTGRERNRIQREEEALKKEFRPTAPPSRARTGGEIEDETIPAAIGESIGTVVSPTARQSVDIRPRTGTGIDDTTIPNRYGLELGGGGTPATTLPNRFGQDIGGGNTPASNLPSSIGLELGTEKGVLGKSSTPSRVGADIGDSSQNRDSLSPHGHGPISPTTPLPPQ